MKKIRLATVVVALYTSLYAADISSAVDELHTLNSSFNYDKKRCNRGSGYAGGVYKNSCLKIECTKILGSISDRHYMKFSNYYDTCSYSSSSTCKEYLEVYENAYTNIDKVCQRHIISL